MISTSPPPTITSVPPDRGFTSELAGGIKKGAIEPPNSSKEKKMTQKALAELTGVSQSLIARIENGSVNPRLSTVRTILAVLYGEEKGDHEINAADLCTKNPLLIQKTKSITNAIDIMSAKGISQIPVIDSDKNIIGSISEKKK